MYSALVESTNNNASVMMTPDGGVIRITAPPSVLCLARLGAITRVAALAGSATAIGLIAKSTAPESAKIAVYVAGSILMFCSCCCRFSGAQTQRIRSNSGFGMV